MQQPARAPAADSLQPLIGAWRMKAVMPSAPPTDVRGRTVFEWTAGRRYLLQRWEVPHPAAPDGVAVIGFDEARDTYLQHYFDERGVARTYEMTFAAGIWTLTRTAPDLSPLAFMQRFTATFLDDRIDGRWEVSEDGETWTPDFDLIYTRQP